MHCSMRVSIFWRFIHQKSKQRKKNEKMFLLTFINHIICRRFFFFPESCVRCYHIFANKNFIYSYLVPKCLTINDLHLASWPHLKTTEPLLQLFYMFHYLIFTDVLLLKNHEKTTFDQYLDLWCILWFFNYIVCFNKIIHPELAVLMIKMFCNLVVWSLIMLDLLIHYDVYS
jgi:hypothetical protein